MVVSWFVSLQQKRAVWVQKSETQIIIRKRVMFKVKALCIFILVALMTACSCSEGVAQHTYIRKVILPYGAGVDPMPGIAQEIALIVIDKAENIIQRKVKNIDPEVYFGLHVTWGQSRSMFDDAKPTDYIKITIVTEAAQSDGSPILKALDVVERLAELEINKHFRKLRDV